MKNYRNHIAAVLAALALGGLGFAAGVAADKDEAPRPAAVASAKLEKDTAFLTFLRGKDVGTTSNEAALELGQKVVAAIKDEGVHPFMVGTRLVTLGYTGDEANTIVTATIAVYLPEFSHTVE